MLHLCFFLFLSLLAVFSPAVLSQDPVSIQFQTAPVQAKSGSQATLTVVTISNVLSMSWSSPGGNVLGLWVANQAAINNVPSYVGRITITATQLQINPTLLTDAGNYSVTVVPVATTGLMSNSRSVQLQVFDAVTGVSLFVPTLALEGNSVTLTCTWTQGTQTVVIWGKGNSVITSGSRVTVSNGSLVINPVNRDDAGIYTCTVKNPVSAVTATANLTVYYGPDTPSLQINGQASCVGGGTVLVGQTVQLTCTSASLPPALFSWQLNGQPVASGQSGSGVLTLQAFTTNQSGLYTCVASNSVTANTATQAVNVAVVSVCLSVGAVVGIAIACVLAFILIIIAIVLLLRWRNMDRRLRNVAEQNKANPNPQVTLPPPDVRTRNMLWNEMHGQHPDPPLHSLIPLPVPDQGNTYTPPLEALQGVSSGPRGGLNWPEPRERSNNSLSHYRQRDGATFLPSGPQNPDGQRNPESQQNPGLFSQVGHMQPSTLPPVIHVTLNTAPPNQGAGNAQPHNVHLNLNAYPLPGPQNSNQFHNSQGSHLNPLLHSNHENAGNHMQNESPSVPQTVAAVVPDLAQDGQTCVANRAPNSGALIQTGFSHTVSPAAANQRNANTQTYWSDGRLAQPWRVQLPWDRLRGTPAYPNPTTAGQALDSSSSSPSSSEPTNSSSTPVRQRVVSHDPGTQSYNIPRNSTTPVALMPSSHRHKIPQNRQHIQVSVPNPVSQGSNLGAAKPLTLQSVRNAVPQSQSPMDPQSQNQRDQLPVGSHSQNQRNQPPVGPHTQNQWKQTPVLLQSQNPRVQAPVDPHGDTSQQLRPSMLTEAALQMHTAKTHNPFQNRNEQTRAALARSQEAAQQARRPPTPPPVIPPGLFKTLPQQHLQEPRPQQPPITHHTLPHALPVPHRSHAHAPTQGHAHRNVHRQPLVHRHHTNQQHVPHGWPRR